METLSTDKTAIPEIPKHGRFMELVEATKRKWRDAFRSPHKEFSQAIDIPERMTRNLVDRVVDNLPSYIPEDVRVKIKETHPNPMVVSGFLVDKRLIKSEKDIDIEAPSWMSKEDVKDYGKGITVLNEIATDTLAYEVENNLAKKSLWFKFSNAISKIENKIFGTVVSKEVKDAQKLLGGKDKFEEFRKNLVLAMLTGDNSKVDEQLNSLGYGDLDRFALEIGREATYSKSLEWMDKVFKNPRVTRILTAGNVSVEKPGIISLNMAGNSPGLLNIAVGVLQGAAFVGGVVSGAPTMGAVMLGLLAVNGFFVARLPTSTQHVIVHETCHYISQDVDRVGIKRYTQKDK